MNTRGLLDQLLKSGQELLNQASKGSGQKPAGNGGLGGLLSGAGGGALAAGAMGLLLGNKKARKYGGKALTYGGLAALGVLAYKAYGNWQARQGAGDQPPQTLDRLPRPRPSSTARRCCGRWWRRPSPMAISTSASGR
jgi:uncharacterized membrane protein YebE (DUF533 family)